MRQMEDVRPGRQRSEPNYPIAWFNETPVEAFFYTTVKGSFKCI